MAKTNYKVIISVIGALLLLVSTSQAAVNYDNDYMILQVDVQTQEDLRLLDAVLQPIEEHGWIVTVYITDELIRAYPDTVANIYMRGHQIALLGTDDITTYSVDGKIDEINSTLNFLKEILAPADIGRLHYKQISYDASYKDSEPLLEALRVLNFTSETGFHPVDEDFKCDYCIRRGRIVHPIDFDGVTVIPIAEVNLSLGEVPLDDRVIFDDLGFTPADFLQFLKDEMSQVEIEEIRAAVVHPSIIASTSDRLNALKDFLNFVEASGGKVVLTEKSTAANIAAGYHISYLSASGPSTANPGDSVTISYTYTTTFYCPTFYFRAYGKYESESDWRMFYSDSFYHNKATKTRSFTTNIPEPPNSTDDTYTVRVVGRSCNSGFACWPEANSYEKMSAVEITIGKPDLNITSKDIVFSTSANRSDKVTIYVTVHNDGNVTARNVDVKFTWKSRFGAYQSEMQVVPSIAAGSSVNVTAIWWATWRGGEDEPDWEDVINVYADPDNKITEEKENNNEAETHKICGNVKRNNGTGLANLFVEYQQDNEAGDTWIIESHTYTDKQGDYCFSTNMNYMIEDRDFRLKSRAIYSPERNNKKALFQMYDDSDWGAAFRPAVNPPVYGKASTSSNLKKDANFLGKDMQYPAHSAIAALDRLIPAYNYFKGRNMQTKKTIFVEVNNNDNAECGNKPTSCASLPIITMWHDRDETDDVEHEYGHLISQTPAWTNKYKPVEENWASYASCLARGSTHYSNWGWDIDITNLEDTDGDRVTNAHTYVGPVWDFQLVGIYNAFGADDTIATLNKKNLQTGRDVYDKYLIVKGYTTNAQKSPIKLLFALHGFDTTLWPPIFFGLFGLSPPYSIQATGADSLIGTFAHGGIDSNSDGLNDYLMVNAEVNITNINENYNLLGYVYDSTNISYCSAVNQTNVTSSGIQNISLYFEGNCIFNRQLNGTLTLQTALLIYQNVSIADSKYNGLNMSYNYTDFNYPSVIFYTGTSVDSAVDNDSDGSYEILQIIVEMNVSTAGNYSIDGVLYSSSDNTIDVASTQITSFTGITNISLNFSGQAVFASGSDGPYNMSLSVYNTTKVSTMLYTYHSKVATSAYNYTDFDSEGAGFNSNITESTADSNNNSLYDAIVLDVSVNATPAGDYTVVAMLVNSSGDVIATATNITNSSLTVQQVYLDFDGMDIRNSTQDGPYNVSLELKGGNVDHSFGSSTVARYNYQTSSYNYTQFEAYGSEFFTINYSDNGSNLVSSKYQFLNVTLNFTAISSDTFYFNGRLYDSAGVFLAQANISSPGSSSMRSIQLAFPGGDIYAGQTNGPYNLTLLIADGNNNLVAQYYSVHQTTNYSYTEFSPHDLYPNGTYSDSGSDVDSDGLYDYLNLDVALTVDASGNYHITALIEDENGTGIATATNQSYLLSGTRLVRLAFDGLTIRNEGKNTTFGLGRLTMYINSSGDTVELYDLYNTSVYNFTQFTSGGSIYGKITYANGTAVNNSLVSAVGSASTTAYTNASGDYNITGLITKTYTLTAFPPSGENLQQNSTTVSVNATVAANADLSLPQGNTVTGIIVDEDGRPANNIYVSLFGATIAYDHTDSTGNYTIAGLADGVHNITVLPASSANLNWSRDNFTISNGSSVTVNFTLAKKGSISGYVFDYNGDPVAYPILHTLYYYLGTTSEDPKFTGEANGSFLLTGLDNDTYPYTGIVNNTFNVMANPPDGSDLLNITESVYAPIGQTSYYNFTLPRSGTVVGLVLDQYGDPVVNANISLKLGSTTVSTATAGSAGNYTLTRVNNATYTVQLDYPTTPTQWLIFVDGVYQAYDDNVDITGVINQTVYVNFTLKVPDGDWRTQGVVSGQANCTDETVTMSGSILATSGTSLTAVNCTLIMNGTSDGQRSIIVENGATFNFTNSIIQSANTSVEYLFKAMPGSTLILRDSTISDVGYTYSSNKQSSGIYIGSNNVIIERNNITNNYYGIILYYANNSQINNNTISNSVYDGVYLYYSNNNTMNYNTIVNSSYRYGIYIYSGSNNTIQNNVIENSSDYGIYITSGGRQNNISNNTLRYNNYGIYLTSSPYNEVSFNTIENSDYAGLYVQYSDYTTLLNNTIVDSGTYGIHLYYSSYGTLSYNALEGSGSGGLYIQASSSSDFNHTIDRFNTVNGKQVRYYYSQNNQVLENKYVGYVGLAYSNNITVNNTNITDSDGVIIYRNSYNNTISNNQINNTPLGLQVQNSDYNTITSNTIYNSSVDGIFINNADHNNISDNTIIQSAQDGIDSDSSHNNSFANNVIKHSVRDGISLSSSDNNRLQNNTVYNSTTRGLYMSYSDNNNLSSNTIYNSSEEGIYMQSSINNNLTSNNLSNNLWNLRFPSTSFAYLNHSIDTTNTVNGYPIYYYFNTSGVTLDSVQAGTIILAHSNLNTISNNVIVSGDGVLLYYGANNNTLVNNNVTWSMYGIYAYYADYNNLSNNFLCGSTTYDLYKYYGTGNVGDLNTCTSTYSWTDTSASAGCTTNCTSNYVTTTTITPPTTTTTVNAITTTSLPYVVEVSLQDPVNNKIDYDGNVFVKYRAVQKASVENCSLYTNISGTWAATNTSTSILNDQVNGFYLSDVVNGTFRWNVLCADLWENERFSGPDRILTINRTSSDIVNTQLNLTANIAINVNLTTGTNVTLDIVTNGTVTNARVMITFAMNSTTNGTFNVSYLNTYISLDADPALTNVLSWAYLTIGYDPTDVTNAGMNETDLALYWYNQSLGNWQELTTDLTWVYDEGVNTAGDYLYANISHLSEYTVAQTQGSNFVSIPLISGWNLISIPLNA